MARGSNDELQTQLVIAGRLVFGDGALLREADGLSEEVGRMLHGLYKVLHSPKD
jgi:hypothetical protein